MLPVKSIMLVRISATAILASVLLTAAAQAQTPRDPVLQNPVLQNLVQQVQFHSMQKLPDPRGEFVRLCAPAITELQ